MKPSKSLKAFRTLLKERAISEKSMTGGDALSVMSEFYSTERAGFFSGRQVRIRDRITLIGPDS